MGFRITGTGARPSIRKTDQRRQRLLRHRARRDLTGEFIPVPAASHGATTAGKLPQDDLEDWSNANNIFQFIRVEDIAYDPDSPRTVYFTDTGNTRLYQEPTTGRLRLLLSSSDPLVPRPRTPRAVCSRWSSTLSDPRKVDAFSVFTDGGTGAGQLNWRSPDNLAVGHSSIMVQEDASNAKIWMHHLGDASTAWTHVATVDQDRNAATSDLGESSGVVDVSSWFGIGWWALDVQAHAQIIAGVEVASNQQMDDEFLT